jgi:hypothetical protein
MEYRDSMERVSAGCAGTCCAKLEPKIQKQGDDCGKALVEDCGAVDVGEVEIEDVLDHAAATEGGCCAGSSKAVPKSCCAKEKRIVKKCAGAESSSDCCSPASGADKETPFVEPSSCAGDGQVEGGVDEALSGDCCRTMLVVQTPEEPPALMSSCRTMNAHCTQESSAHGGYGDTALAAVPKVGSSCCVDESGVEEPATEGCSKSCCGDTPAGNDAVSTTSLDPRKEGCVAGSKEKDIGGGCGSRYCDFETTQGVVDETVHAGGDGCCAEAKSGRCASASTTPVVDNSFQTNSDDCCKEIKPGCCDGKLLRDQPCIKED